MRTRYPDFFVIGAMKAGTTSLHHYLRAHPRLFLPPEKEVAFFALDSYYERGMTWYLGECFRGSDDSQLAGTVSPLYMIDPRVPARMHDLCPDARLIALLRDPIDRARSHYRMMVRAFGERRTFDELVREQLAEPELRRLREPPEPGGGSRNADEFSSARKFQSAYVVRGEYGRILDRYLEQYPPDSLLVVYSRDLETDPAASVARIFRFLGVEGVPIANLGRRYHVGAEAGNRRLARIAAGTLKWRLGWLRALAKRVVPAAYRRRLKLWSVMNRAGGSVPHEAADVLDPGTERALARHYLEDARRLEALTGSPPPWRRSLEALAAADGPARTGADGAAGPGPGAPAGHG